MTPSPRLAERFPWMRDRAAVRRCAGWIAGYTAALAVVLAAPAWVLAIPGAAASAAVWLEWRRKPAGRMAITAAWVPLHLFVVATGGAASPLLPIVVLWAVLAAPAVPARAVGPAGFVGFLLLFATDSAVAGLDPARVLAVAAATVAATAAAALVGPVRRRVVRQDAELARIREEAEAGREDGAELDAARRLSELEQALDSVRASIDSTRVVLWDVSADAERARPRAVSGGAMPAPVSLQGDPLHWALTEGMQLTLDHPPRWSAPDARVVAVPLKRLGKRTALLTVELEESVEPPAARVLEEAAAYVRTFVWMQQREAQANAARQRFNQVLAVLRALRTEIELNAFSETLADAARRLAGGTGAAVALWDGESGRIIATVGEDGGPAKDADFTSMQSELALAVRSNATILRENRRGSRDMLPVAAPEERWYAEPGVVTALPLRDASDRVVGGIVVWSTERVRFDAEALAGLQAVAPYAALQLEHARAYGSLREHAEIDALTRLHNRRAFDERLAAESTHFNRYRRPAALLLLDIDHFKETNDTYGHEAGDAVLQAVGKTIEAVVRDADFAARYGGEEFVVLLPETRLPEALDAAERLRERIERIEVPWNGRTIHARASVGVTACPECVPDPASLVRSADAMLYRSKAAGRNRVTSAPLAETDSEAHPKSPEAGVRGPANG